MRPHQGYKQFLRGETIMAMSRKLERLLKAQHVSFSTLAHAEAFTSQDVAHAVHIPGRQIAKVVAFRDDRGRWLLAVVPAPCRVDLRSLATLSGHHELRLASERELARRFPDAEPGAMPPFDGLYQVPVFIDLAFADHHEIFFEDGTHRGLVGMHMPDYMRVAEPIAGRFAMEPAGH
jgi:Ala-tRNA(Pro) deacylase